MKDICLKYCTKINTHINSLLFLYGGNQLNMEKKFEDQANSTDKENKEMNILVYATEGDNFICPKCGEKIELNSDKINEIVKSNNNIKDTINGVKVNIENIVKTSKIDEINIQLKNIIVLLNTINESIKTNNEKLKNLLKENTSNDSIINNDESENKNIIRGMLEAKLNDNNIILFNTDKNDGIDVYIENNKMKMIKDNKKWKIDYKFERKGKYNFQIIFAQKMTTMYGFFGECNNNIISLDLSNFNTDQVTNMAFMFNKCHKLKEINGINNFNTGKVTAMNLMFNECYELEYLDLSNFNTHQVTNMECMFNKCSKLKEIKGINKFNTEKVTDMSAMFQNCNQLEYLDLSGFNTHQVNNMGGMFNLCQKLKEIKGINKFNTDKVTDMKAMFQECKELEKLDLSNFNTFQVTNMEWMFHKCSKLKEINLSNFVINCDKKNTKNMFKNIDKKKCKLLTNNNELMKLFKSS